MRKIKVLLADDSVGIRRVVKGWLATVPDVEVAGFAVDGVEALEMLERVQPDVVVLDVEMPRKDGLETLKEIRSKDKQIPIIMFSTLTSRGGTVTLEALALGATDYVPKPTSLGDSEVSPDEVRDRLVEKIRALHERRVARKSRVHVAAPPPRPTPATGKAVDVIAIGTSTGGPTALETVFRELPATLPVPVVVVQHMPPLFTKSLAERLSRVSGLRVEEAVHGEPLEAGRAWIAPGGHHMVVEREGPRVVVYVNDDPPENSCRPAVDVLFRSVARVYGAHSLGIVLTGMGADGMRGAQAIREAGGQVVAQDEETSVVWGMPGAVVKAGLAQSVLPIEHVASDIQHRLRLKSPARTGT